MAGTQTLWRRSIGGFIPADPEAQELFDKLDPGQVVRAEVKRMRHPAHHRKLFALLKLCVENSEGWSTESLLDYLKIETGHFTPITFPAMPGYVFKKPKSISFGNMGQDAFEKFYSAAIDVMLRDVVPHIPADELRSAVEMQLVVA
jgi:hypothetical protein